MTFPNGENPIARLQRYWQRLHHLPGGAWLFSRILGWVVPYTGTIGADVKELTPGYARIQLRDRRRVRNHLHSVHALALANLGEVASGLAMMGALSAGTRGIPTKLTIEFYKKARGLLIAESFCSPPTVTRDTDFEVHADIRDTEGDVVARTTVNWRLGPVPPAP
ncbi:MAG: hotdog fold domain-containing protein [Acidiferrobacterales bacterium]